MKIYFLRHTSLKVGLNTFYGQTDVDVSDSFFDEANKVKKKIVKECIDLKKIKIYSSPLKRCIKLTDQITKKYEVEDRVKEMNLGDWEMKKMDEIPKEKIKKWEENLMTYKIPNGESNEEFLNRLSAFINEILEKKNDVLIVCHAGSINGMISILTNEPFDKMVKNYWEKISYGSLSLIEIKEKKVLKRIIGR